MIFPDDIVDDCLALTRAAQEIGHRVATAESCTAGLLAGALTSVEGSSALLERGYVTYSNGAKEEMLDVPHQTLELHGAVSAETARAMAEGALKNAQVDAAISITGIAGPTGGSEEKPVGLVYFALAAEGRETQVVERRFGDIGREEIRLHSVRQALQMLKANLNRQ